jgi:general secretion pathway protein C
MAGVAALPALAALVLSALVAGSVVYWALKWPASRPATALQSTQLERVSGADPSHLARALGDLGLPAAAAPAAPLVAAPSIASRLSLVGVVANGRQGGTALISIDGKPARPFRVGAKVEGDWLVKSVAQRRAVLSLSETGPNNAAKPGKTGDAGLVTLDLPVLKGR